jgi:hypothetical protein
MTNSPTLLTAGGGDMLESCSAVSMYLNTVNPFPDEPVCPIPPGPVDPADPVFPVLPPILIPMGPLGPGGPSGPATPILNPVVDLRRSPWLEKVILLFDIVVYILNK